MLVVDDRVAGEVGARPRRSVGAFAGGGRFGPKGEGGKVEILPACEREPRVVGVLYVGTHDARARVVPFEQDGAGAVPEEDAGGAVGPVDDARHALDADHKGAAHGVARPPGCVGGGHHALGGDQPVDAAGAGGVEVEGHGVGQAKAGLDERRLARDEGIAGESHADDEVDACGLDGAGGRKPGAPFPAKGPTAGGGCQVGGRFAGGNGSRVNARARHNPFVRCVDDAGQSMVRDGEGGRRLARSDDGCAHVTSCGSPFAPAHMCTLGGGANGCCKCLDNLTK